MRNNKRFKIKNRNSVNTTELTELTALDPMVASAYPDALSQKSGNKLPSPDDVARRVKEFY